MDDTTASQDAWFDGSDPRAREPLVDLRDAGIAGLNYYADRTGANPPYGGAIPGSIEGLYARHGLLARLDQANRTLAASGCELFVFDAYRPIGCQIGLWNFFQAKFANDNPSLDAAGIERRLAHFVSDPRLFDEDRPETWPVHSSGGAIDLVLRDRSTHALLPMGAAFDQMDGVSATAYYETLLARSRIASNDDVLRNRRLLYWTMIEAGLTNYRNEYWHYDFGDRFYCLERNSALRSARPSYWYGYVPPADVPGSVP